MGILMYWKITAAAALALSINAPAWAQAAVAPAPAAPVPAGKLTGQVQPQAYRLDLTIDPNQERFAGKSEIDAVLKVASRTIDLHWRDLKLQTVEVIAGGQVLKPSWQQVDETGVGRLTFAEAVPAGPITLRFAYDGPFQSAPAGLFRVKVGDDWYAWTQLQSIDARGVFPSFDEPGFKTPFTVTLRTPPGQTAVSNAPQTGVSREGGLDVHTFAPTLPLPTYLVAAMVGPFAVVEGSVSPTPQRATPLPLRIISPKPNAGRLGFALEGSKEIVRLLESYFGDAFPYPKLDQITTPILPGAMENAGADLYNDSIIVMDEQATTGQKRTFGMVVAHELAHQWFGDLVTPAWWDDIWLNESFANWMGFRIGDEWRPALNIRAGAVEEGFSAMRTDALVAGRPIRQPIETNAQIDEAFDSITYGKGGHVVAMIAGYMGDDKFRDGVRRYMAAHRYGNATSTAFFKAMAEASGDPRIVPAMQSFTDQQGVPLLTFARSGKGWQVSQSRYARLGSTAPATRWGVPLCLRTTGGARQCQLLTEARMTVSYEGKGALVPNAGGTGYYRFELPAAEWDKLIAGADKLPGGEAQALADSINASFQAGRATPAQLVAAARKLAFQRDSYASGAGIGTLSSYSDAGFLDEAGKAGFQRLTNGIYGPRLKQLGFDPRAGAYAGHDPEETQARQQAVGALARKGGDPAVRAQLLTATRAFLAGDNRALDGAWYGAGLGLVVEEGGLAAAKDLVNRALTSTDPVFRPVALGVVGGSGQAVIGRWILEQLQDSRLRTSERQGLIRMVVSTGATRDLGWDWLKSNYEKLAGSGGGIFFASRLPEMLSGNCSVARADEITALLRPKLQGKTGALGLERSIERVRSCGVLKDARGAELSAVLAQVK
jgi:aminopeptidase N